MRMLSVSLSLLGSCFFCIVIGIPALQLIKAMEGLGHHCGQMIGLDWIGEQSERTSRGKNRRRAAILMVSDTYNMCSESDVSKEVGKGRTRDGG